MCRSVTVWGISCIFHPTRLFRPTQLLIWMNFPPYTTIPHCTAIRHYIVGLDTQFLYQFIDHKYELINLLIEILTTNLAAVVCVCVCVCVSVCVDVCQCAKFDQFLSARSHSESKRSENFVRIAKFPYAAFGPLFAFHCPLFFTRNKDLEWKNRHASPLCGR